jgi:hypothetical protein
MLLNDRDHVRSTSKCGNIYFKPCAVVLTFLNDLTVEIGNPEFALNEVISLYKKLIRSGCWKHPKGFGIDLPNA